MYLYTWQLLDMNPKSLMAKKCRSASEKQQDVQVPGEAGKDPVPQVRRLDLQLCLGTQTCLDHAMVRLRCQRQRLVQGMPRHPSGAQEPKQRLAVALLVTNQRQQTTLQQRPNCQGPQPRGVVLLQKVKPRLEKALANHARVSEHAPQLLKDRGPGPQRLARCWCHLQSQQQACRTTESIPECPLRKS